jgi:hypothetical protein
MLQESIDFHEQVLGIMDDSIQVYSPELLQNRISILRWVAVIGGWVGGWVRRWAECGGCLGWLCVVRASRIAGQYALG